MRSLKGRFSTFLPYFGMVVALCLSAWTFIQSEHYRQETDEILNQTFEIQWRATQIHEQILRVFGYLRLAQETGKLDADIDRQMALLRVNVSALQSLPYLRRVFPAGEIALLDKFRQMIEQKIVPVVEARSGYGESLAAMTELDQTMHEITSGTVDHRGTLQHTAVIDAAASRNWFIFALALGFGAIFCLVIYQRYSFVNRRDQHMRSVASLFGHLTRSRITALRLFLEHLRSDRRPSNEMVEAAHAAATELECINDSLLKTAYAPRDSRAAPLRCLLEDLVQAKDDLIRLSLTESAGAELVPAAPFKLLSDEIVENALAALAETKNPQILISAIIKWHPISGRSLFLEVTDNGAGMTPAILNKATTPFFSTRAGNHAGLGLTACSRMVETLKGKLVIKSTAGIGTTVRLRIPIQRFPIVRSVWKKICRNGHDNAWYDRTIS